MDVQGYEDPVLKGATQALRRTRFLLIEVTFTPVYQGACLVDQLCHNHYGAAFRLARTVVYPPGTDVDQLVSSDFFFRNSLAV
jgi:hypothetical protein